MGSINRVFLLGRLGKDPELRHTQSGRAVASWSMATSESWTDKESGEKNEKTTWTKCVAWGRTAEIAAEHLAKGSEVHIEGRLQNRDYEDKEGVKRYVTEVLVDRLTFVGAKRASTSSGSGAPEGYSGAGGLDPDDQIPF